jgi:inner membrane transporter RhtA
VSEPSGRGDATIGAACVLAGAISIQSAAALAVGAFVAIGAASTSGFRFLFGALIAVVAVRPALRGRSRREWRGIAAFGAAAAVMNLCFFQALARLPLGTAVSIEFLGPFVLAVVAGRGRRHLAFAFLGFIGVLLLARPGGGVTLLGAIFALGAALGWACYTLASQRLGSLTDGVDGLALALCVAALLTLPFCARAFPSLDWTLAGRLAAMAVLSVVVGFALELTALRRLDASSVAVLLSLNPAVAFAIGWLSLGQHVAVTSLVGGLLVVAAGVGVTGAARRGAPALPPS